MLELEEERERERDLWARSSLARFSPSQVSMFDKDRKNASKGMGKKPTTQKKITHSWKAGASNKIPHVKSFAPSVNSVLLLSSLSLSVVYLTLKH